MTSKRMSASTIRKILSVVKESGATRFEMSDSGVIVEFCQEAKEAKIIRQERPKTTEDKRKEYERILFHSANGG